MHCIYNKVHWESVRSVWECVGSVLGVCWTYVQSVWKCVKSMLGETLPLPPGLSPAARKDKQALRVARETAAAMGVPVHYVEKHDLNMISNNRPHQVCVRV